MRQQDWWKHWRFFFECWESQPVWSNPKVNEFSATKTQTHTNEHIYKITWEIEDSMTFIDKCIVRCWNQASSDTLVGMHQETEVWVHFVWLLAYETLLLLSQPFGDWFPLSIDQNLLHLVTRWHSDMGPNLPNLMHIPFTGPLSIAIPSEWVRSHHWVCLKMPLKNSLPEDWMATSHICARSDMGVAKWTRPSMQLKSLTHACAQGKKNLGLKIKRERERDMDRPTSHRGKGATTSGPVGLQRRYIWQSPHSFLGWTFPLSPHSWDSLLGHM